jgi:hypothetical protein
VKAAASVVHRKKGLVIFLNKTNVSGTQWGKIFDYHLAGDLNCIIQWIRYGASQFGWQSNTEECFETKSASQTTLVTEHPNTPVESSGFFHSVHKQCDATFPHPQATLRIAPSDPIPKAKAESHDDQESTCPPTSEDILVHFRQQKRQKLEENVSLNVASDKMQATKE